MKEVYSIQDFTNKQGEKQSKWTRIGVAFTNKDASLNVILDVIPLNGRIHIRDPRPAEEVALDAAE